MKEHFVIKTVTIFTCLMIFGCQDKNHETDWVKLPAPDSATISCFAETSGGIFFVGASELYKSKDNGKSYELVEFNGLPMEIIETKEGTLLVGTYRSGIFRSIDQGRSWMNVGFENNVYIFKIIQTEDGKIFASATFVSEGDTGDSTAGVFVSEDDGVSWRQTALTAHNIKGVFNPRSGVLFASGTGENNFYRSPDGGQTWSSEISGMPDSIPVSAIVDLNGTLFASLGDPQDAARTIGGGIYKSTDNGLSWIRSDDGLAKDTKVSDLTILDNSLFASTGDYNSVGSQGVFRSDDQGVIWYESGLNDSHLRLIRTISEKRLIAGSNASSLFVSNDTGKNWIQTGKGIENWSLFQVLESNDYLYANGESGIWRSAIPVKEWVHIRKEMGSLIKLPNGDILTAESGKILRTDDNGDHWTQIADLKSDMVFLYEMNSNLLVACAQEDGMYFSTNEGRDWSKYNFGKFELNTFRTAMQTANGALLIGTGRGTLRSEDQGKTWDNVDENFFAWTFTENDKVIYAGGYANGVHKSTDNGLTWTTFNTGLRSGDAYLTVTSLCTTSDSSVICGTLGEGIYKLKAGDSIWSDYKRGLKSPVNFEIIEGANRTLYTTSEKGIFKRSF